MEQYAPCESPLNRAAFGARPADAFDAVAWRAAPGRSTTVAPEHVEDRAVPRWMVITIGCLVAMLMGVIAGSAFAL
jgi:hypothetical protein